jgi:hypothetical protein
MRGNSEKNFAHIGRVSQCHREQTGAKMDEFIYLENKPTPFTELLKDDDPDAVEKGSPE